MPKTRKSGIKRKKYIRRTLRKMKGGVLTEEQQQAVDICNFIIKGLQNKLRYQEHYGSSNTEEITGSFDFHTIDTRFKIKEMMEKKVKGFQYLINHMTKKQKNEGALKSFGKVFTTEKVTPYKETIHFIKEFYNHVLDFGMIKHPEGLPRHFTYFDIKRLIGRFEKIKQEIESSSSTQA